MGLLQSVSFLLVSAGLQTALGRADDAGSILWPPIYNEIRIEDAPFMVGLLTADDLSCGGSIVHEQFILTSAFCVKYGKRVERAFVGTNLVDLYSTSFHQIAGELCHGRFETEPLKNDICLLKLKSPLALSDKVAKIKLAHEMYDSTPDGTIVNVTGWHTTNRTTSVYDRHPLHLRQAATAILPVAECRAMNERAPWTGTTLCTDAPDGDSCEGDIGGPLTLNNVQIGILSLPPSYLDCRKYPSVYTKVSRYLKWIRITITNNL